MLDDKDVSLLCIFTAGQQVEQQLFLSAEMQHIFACHVSPLLALSAIDLAAAACSCRVLRDTLYHCHEAWRHAAAAQIQAETTALSDLDRAAVQRLLLQRSAEAKHNMYALQKQLRLRKARRLWQRVQGGAFSTLQHVVLMS